LGKSSRASFQEVLTALTLINSKSFIRDFEHIHKLHNERDQEIQLTEKNPVLTDLLVKIHKAKKMVEFTTERDSHSLAFYYVYQEIITVSTDNQMGMTISQNVNANELKDRIARFYGADMTLEEDPMEMTINFSEKDYNQLHHKGSDELAEMILDEQVDDRLRSFLKDFKENHQTASRIHFKEKENEKDFFKDSSVLFFVPNKEYIWHIKYDEIQQKKVFAMSNSLPQYFTGVEFIVNKFFEEGTSSLSTKKSSHSNKVHNEKFFSLKRGFSFFYKSNIAVMIGLVCFFINQSSWGEEGRVNVLIAFILAELFLTLLSLIACFKEKKLA